jgi:hypothetical protein
MEVNAVRMTETKSPKAFYTPEASPCSMQETRYDPVDTIMLLVIPLLLLVCLVLYAMRGDFLTVHPHEHDEMPASVLDARRQPLQILRAPSQTAAAARAARSMAALHLLDL